MALQNRGIVKTAQGRATLGSVPVPKLRDDYVLVRTVAVALNPNDWQTLDDPFRPGTTRSLLGSDAAGTVVEVGKAVTKSFKLGDRIAGMSHSGNDLNPEDGTFAEYITMKGDIAMHIPPNISFEEAATLPSGILTVALGMYRYLELPLLALPLEPKSTGQPIFIYGGSSATGTLAIQFAKLQVNPPMAHVYKDSQHDPECGSKIREITTNSLQLVLDTIATPSSAQICAEALSSTGGGLYVNLMGIEMPREDVKSIFFLGHTIRGEAFEYEGETWPAVPEDYELGKKFFALTEKLLAMGKIQSHPAEVRSGGLGKILDGMQDMKEGRISGVKLVYRVDETGA
ncbi:MAG: hypothetical protein M1818_008478 [Claussenomyces sp. TS43310]|nr:MAG: hypothetical protein M1818_008478 [Claussenomyces sp. TS43310]